MLLFSLTDVGYELTVDYLKLIIHEWNASTVRQSINKKYSKTDKSVHLNGKLFKLISPFTSLLCVPNSVEWSSWSTQDYLKHLPQFNGENPQKAHLAIATLIAYVWTARVSSCLPFDITFSTVFCDTASASLAHSHFSMSLIVNLWALESDYRHIS